MKALAALCEGDLCQSYRPSTLSAELMGERGIMESLWRVRRRSSTSGAIKDGLSEVSVMDALDESSGSLWVVMQTPALGAASEIYGVTTPPEVQSSRRCKDEGTIFRITPLRSRDPSVSHGFTLSSFTCTRPSAPSLALLSSMPSFALRAVIRRRVLELTDAFGQYVQARGSLDERLSTSRWAVFYSEVRRRLEGDIRPAFAGGPPPGPGGGTCAAAGFVAEREVTTPATATPPSMDDTGDGLEDHDIGEVAERCESQILRHALDQAVKP